MNVWCLMVDVATGASIFLLGLNVPANLDTNWMLIILPATVYYSTYSDQFTGGINGIKLFKASYFPCIPDINECLDTKVCQFQCINTPGSFRCINFCSTGYEYDEITNECLGEFVSFLEVAFPDT